MLCVQPLFFFINSFNMKYQSKYFTYIHLMFISFACWEHFLWDVVTHDSTERGLLVKMSSQQSSSSWASPLKIGNVKVGRVNLRRPQKGFFEFFFVFLISENSSESGSVCTRMKNWVKRAHHCPVWVFPPAVNFFSQIFYHEFWND